VESGGECALHVAQDALDQREMKLAGIMHEEAHLLNSIRQVWACERQVL